MKINCPHCGQHYEVEDSDVGKEADCTNCGKRFQVKVESSVDGSNKIKKNEERESFLFSDLGLFSQNELKQGKSPPSANEKVAADTPEQPHSGITKTTDDPSPSKESSGDVNNVDNESVPIFDAGTKGCLLNVFLWVRRIGSVICVAVAMYMMFDVRSGLKENLEHEDSAIRAVSKKTMALVDLIPPLMLMLFALYIKPERNNEK